MTEWFCGVMPVFSVLATQMQVALRFSIAVSKGTGSIINLDDMSTAILSH
jgi:hypothetical protein